MATRYVVPVLVICLISQLLGGCIEFYSYRAVDVSVRDAETDRPISNARVHASYVADYLLDPPKEEAATTNAQGTATVRAATFKYRSWSAVAHGYLGTGAYDGALATGEDKDGTHLLVRLYREPEPQITIIVPNGYRGPLLVEKRPVANWIQDQSGKRDFTYRASLNGYVGIDATPLLMRQPIYGPIRVVDESGHSFSRSTNRQSNAGRLLDDGDVSLNWGWFNGNSQMLYVIGSAKDDQAVEAYAAVHKASSPEDNRRVDAMVGKMFEKARREADQK